MAPSTWWASRTTTEAAWPTQDLATPTAKSMPGSCQSDAAARATAASVAARARAVSAAMSATRCCTAWKRADGPAELLALARHA